MSSLSPRTVISYLVLWRQHDWPEAHTRYLKDAHRHKSILGIPSIPGGEFCVNLDFRPSYNGTVNTTLNGLTCQRWDSQHPHKHFYINPSLFPETALEDVANYCRTPDGSEWPWCFTTSSEVRSELCHFDVKLCASEEPPGNAWEFNEQFQLARCKTVYIKYIIIR